MNSLYIFFIIVAILLLWLNIIATFAICKDSTIENHQRKYQIGFVWLIPMAGSLIFLHLVHSHSPEALSTSLIPWPFKKIIKGKTYPANKNPDNSDHAIDLAITSSHDYSGVDSVGHE